ncbi:Hypothetical protein MVR_LOCUS129 [uncultured virus]|nr:Hypothetical protein MVR_LOCUS129 [uncultured virus]
MLNPAIEDPRVSCPRLVTWICWFIDDWHWHLLNWQDDVVGVLAFDHLARLTWFTSGA